MSLTAYDVEELQMILAQHQEALYVFREAEELHPVLMNDIFQGDTARLSALRDELQSAPSPVDRQLKFQRALLDALETRLHSLPYLQPQPNLNKQRQFYTAHLKAMPRMHDSQDTCPKCGHQSEEHKKVARDGPYHIHRCQKCGEEWSYYYWDVSTPEKERGLI